MLQINEWILHDIACLRKKAHTLHHWVDMLNRVYFEVMRSNLNMSKFFQRIEEKVHPGFYAATEV